MTGSPLLDTRVLVVACHGEQLEVKSAENSSDRRDLPMIFLTWVCPDVWKDETQQTCPASPVKALGKARKSRSTDFGRRLDAPRPADKPTSLVPEPTFSLMSGGITDSSDIPTYKPLIRR